MGGGFLRRWRALLCLAALVAVAALGPRSSGALVEGQVVAASTAYYPGDDAISPVVGGQARTLLILPQGSELTFTNLDSVNSHSLTSDTYDETGPYGYLFDSGPTLVNFRVSTVVEGVSALAPGLYPFHCRQVGHGMRGYLQIV